MAVWTCESVKAHTWFANLSRVNSIDHKRQKDYASPRMRGAQNLGYLRRKSNPFPYRKQSRVHGAINRSYENERREREKKFHEATGLITYLRMKYSHRTSTSAGWQKTNKIELIWVSGAHRIVSVCLCVCARDSPCSLYTWTLLWTRRRRQRQRRTSLF